MWHTITSQKEYEF